MKPTPTATGSKAKQTVGSSVLPPPPLPISLASVHALAHTSPNETGRADRSITVSVAIRFCGSSDRPAARSYPAPGTPAR
jgi:hypothetical protein